MVFKLKSAALANSSMFTPALESVEKTITGQPTNYSSFKVGDILKDLATVVRAVEKGNHDENPNFM